VNFRFLQDRFLILIPCTFKGRECDTFQNQRLSRKIFCSGVTFDDKTEFRIKSDFCRFKSPTNVPESPRT
jgi:hypothetical protein